jgi:hypothetical protein
MFSIFRSLAAMLLLTAGAVGAQAAICRAAADGNAADDGSTWAAATTLPAALLNTSCTEIWLKQGLYRAPNQGFAIERPLHLYGGFKGNEALRAQRATNSRLTVLSGDIAGDDVVDARGIVHTPSDVTWPNAVHVLTIGGLGVVGNGVYTPANTVIDGLTLTAGYADTSTGYEKDGGGLLCNGIGAGKECSPRIANVTFSGNYAGTNGGGMVAMAHDGGAVRPVITHSLFTGNHADMISGFGAGLAALTHGSGTVEPRIAQSTFTGNQAQRGGAVGVKSPDTQGVLHLEFSTLADNNASESVIHGEGMRLTLEHSVVWGNSLGGILGLIDGSTALAALDSLLWNFIEGGCGRVTPAALCGGPSDSRDPLLAPLADNGGPTWTRLPAAASPVRSVWTCTPGDTDQRGAQRPTGGDACDAGAVQHFDGVPAAPATFSVGGGEERQMTLSWAPVPGAVDYVVEDITGAAVEVCRTSGTACVFSGLGDGDARNLRVRALNEQGASPPLTGGATTRALGAPGPVGAAPIPSLSTWGLLMLTGLLGALAAWRRRAGREALA